MPSNALSKAVHVFDENGVHLLTLKPPQGVPSWTPLGICCTPDDEVFVANFPMSGSLGSIYSYSTETGDYIGCITEDVNNPAGLALMDNGDKTGCCRRQRSEDFPATVK